MAYARYYRKALKPEEKPLYDALVAGFSSMDAEFPIPYAPHLNPSRYSEAVKLDYPEFFYVDYSNLHFLFSGSQSKVVAGYHASAPLAKRQVAQIHRAAITIVRSCPGGSLMDIERCLYDKLAEMCTYGTTPDREHDAHNLCGAFLDHLCVCEGYAKAFKYLCDLAKLQCLVVTGEASLPNQESGPHAWNMVNLDGHIYHVDVTFAHLIDRQFISKAYFNLSDAEIKIDHTPSTSMFRLPPSSRSGAVIPLIGGTRQLMDHLRNEHARHARYTEVLLTVGFPQNTFLSMMREKLRFNDHIWYNAIKASYYRNDARSLVIVWR